MATQLDYRLPEFRQAYLTEIFAVAPLARKRIYIDAQTGMIIAEENRLCSLIDEEGTAETAFSGTQTITTDSNNGEYRLRESGRNIITLDADTGEDFTNPTNEWTPAAGDANEHAVDAHYGAEVYYDMMLDEYGRNSVDNQGLPLVNSVHTTGSFNNAVWTGDGATFGNGDNLTYNHFATPETVGHEYQHGTTEFTAGLYYVNESGGVNEFFSDVFGHLTDIRARGAENAEWLVGDQLTIDGSGARNMSDPNSFNMADTYGGEFYNYVTAVHFSSSVGNYWYYLLSAGATGTNDFGTEYDVPGIGTDKAGQIALRTLVYYLTPTSDFTDVSFFSKQAAIDLYGGCSDEVAAVVEAWRAVAIDVSDDAGFVADFQADNLQCEDPATVSFQNLSSATTSVLWDFGDGNTSTENSPQHTYATGGIYTVTMTATGCNGESETMTKQNYVNINPDASFCNSINMIPNGQMTVTDCSGRIFDSGGPDGAYLNNENTILIIDPPSDAPVTLDFLFFFTENFFDKFGIFDGAGIEAPLIGIYDGTDLMGESYTSTGGAVTIRFISDGSVRSLGYEILYTTDGGEVPTVADFTVSDMTPALNAPVEFTSAAQGTGITSYDFGDGTTALGENVVHHFTEPGTYTVTQTAENCLGSDQKTETVTVGAAGDFAVNPESLTVTLDIGDTTDETVVITNAAEGELYHAFSPAAAAQEFVSEIPYYEESAVTEHLFPDIHPMTTALELAITLNGNYAEFDENATLFINGTDYGIVDDGDTEDGEAATAIYTFTDPDEVGALIASGNIEVTLQNSLTVEVLTDGTHTHRVELTTTARDFLTIDQPVAYTAPNSTTTLNFNFDTEGLLGGTYSYDMALRTGDPDQFDTVYPITLIVVGQAEVAVTPGAVDFGEGFPNTVFVQELLIENAGTDTLYVTGITSNDPIFGTTETAFTVPPFGNYAAEVTFSPTENGVYAGNFTVENNVENIVVPVSGTSSAAPVSALGADNITVELAAEATTVEPFDLSNSGEAQLDWTILPDDLNNLETDIVIWTYGTRQDPEVMNIIELLENIEGNYTVTEDNSNTVAGLRASMEGTEIIIVPNIRDGFIQLYSDVVPAVREYLRTGGSVIALSETANGFMRDSEVLTWNISSFTYDQVMTVEQPNHPLAAGLPATFQNPIGTVGLTFTAPDVEIIVRAEDGSAQLAYRDFGLGKMIYYGNTYFNFAAEDVIMFANAVKFAHAAGLPRWLIPVEMTGNVAGGTTENVDLEFDATDMYAGTYTHDLSLETNEPGKITPTVAVTLNVSAAPEVNFLADREHSCDGFISFTDDSANEPTSWLWDFGDNVTSTEQNPTHFFGTAGMQDVTLTACNETGCNTVTKSNFIEIDLEGTYCDSISMPHDSEVYVTGCTGYIYDTGGPLFNFADNNEGWLHLNTDAGQTLTLIINYFKLDVGGDFLRIYDGPNADAPLIADYTSEGPDDGTELFSSGSEVTFHFKSNNFTNFYGFEIAYSCNEAALPDVNFSHEIVDCGNQVAFTNETTGGTDFVWNFGDGSLSYEESPVHSYSEPGTYSALLLSYNGAGGNFLSQTVTVEEVPFELSIDAPGGVQVGVPTAFTYSASTALTDVQWSSGAGFLSNDETAIFTYQQEGEVTLTLTGTDANGCQMTAEQTVNVGISDTDNVNILTAFDLYPNPTDGALTVSIVLPEAADTEVTVYNTLGQMLLSEKRDNTTSYNHRLDIANLPAGQYFVVLAVDGEILGREAVVKQ